MSKLASILLALTPALAWGQALAAPAGGTGTLILDESAYWRYHVQFGIDRISPELLRSEGKQVLGEKGLARLEQMVRRWRRPPFVPASRPAEGAGSTWQDDAPFWVTQVANVGCDDERISFHISTPPPPPDWMQPGFDEAAWPRQKLPLMVGNIYRPGKMHGDLEMQQLLVRGAYFRSTFELPDPAAGGDCTLKLSYRGGARVFLNGVELTRAHLPPGQPDENASAEPYPAEAYVCRDDESNATHRERLIRRVGSGYVDFCPDLAGRFEDAFVDAPPAAKGEQDHWGGIVNRKGWRRITGLRNRVLGPLELPKRLLRKGTNLLAVEVRAADLHPIVAAGRGADWGGSFIMGANYTWSHCRLLELELRCSGQAPSALHRPPGVQVWVEDMHRRLYSPDFGPRDGPARAQTVRFVGPVNGVCSAQLAVGTDRDMTGVRAACSGLRSETGGVLPASAIRVGYLAGHAADKMVALGQWRGLPEVLADPLCPPAEMALLRHGSAEARASRLSRSERLKEIAALEFFDHIVKQPPARVPAGTCQPIWLSLKLPPDAASGTYRGSVRVTPDGVAAVELPIAAEVFNWHVPDPRHFQSFFAGEQSPYGVAKHYQVPLWSQEHFRLMESSFRQLARLGSRWLFVPVIQTTEFGNLKDSIIVWTRKADGRLAFDFSTLDRYVDLASRCMGRPEVICFVVAHGTDAGDKATVSVFDEKTGQSETLDLSPTCPQYRANWEAFSVALSEHLKSRDLEDTLYWGFGWDGIGDAELIPLLAESVPEAVRWARGSHAYNRAPGGWAEAFTAYSSIYNVPITEDSMEGWRRRDLCLLNPRAGCSVASGNGHSPPFAYRLLMDRALVAGCRGLARMGADYWDGVFYQGYSGRAWPGSLPGIGCLSLLWAGQSGGEPSQRFEALLEGIQEAEARIFLEQSLRCGALGEDLSRQVRDVLTRHHRETLYMPVGRIGVQIQEYSAGWQERSRRLYHAAEQAAQAVAFDVDRTEIARELPARATGELRLTLRNWTNRPRAWKAESDAPWLLPQRRSGDLAGQETLTLRADAAALKPGQPAEATLTVTDVQSGRSWPVKVTARAGEVFDFVVGRAYDFLGKPGHAAAWDPKRVEDFATFNVRVGGSESRQFVFINESGLPLSYRIESPAAWLKVSPAAGKLASRARTTVEVTAEPPDRSAARHELKLVVREAGGPARQEAKLVVHVIPPYRPPALPEGRAVYLAELPKAMVKSHRSRAYWYGSSDPGRDDYGPKFDQDRNIIGGTPQWTVYDIQAKGYTAFAATVKLSGRKDRVGESAEGKRASFEVHVDGRLRAQSGLMTAADEPRLLVVEGLAGAKELKLLVRWDRPEPKYLGGTVGTLWLQPRLYLPP